MIYLILKSKVDMFRRTNYLFNPKIKNNNDFLKKNFKQDKKNINHTK